jgi:hypothetical protein
MIHLPCGYDVSQHPTIGLVVGESKRLKALRFDCIDQRLEYCMIGISPTYHTQHDVPKPVLRFSSHSSAQARWESALH